MIQGVEEVWELDKWRPDCESDSPLTHSKLGLALELVLNSSPLLCRLRLQPMGYLDLFPPPFL